MKASALLMCVSALLLLSACSRPQSNGAGTLSSPEASSSAPMSESAPPATAPAPAESSSSSESESSSSSSSSS